MLLKLTSTFTDSSLTAYKRDVLLSGDNGGVKFLFDLAYTYSYAGGTPVNASPINDVSDTANGSFVLQSGETMSYAGGGFDYGALTKHGTFVQGAGALATSVWGSANQYFLIAGYFKLPTQAQWNSAGTIFEFFRVGANSYTAAPNIIMMAQQATTSAITVRRQTGAGTADILSALVPAAGDYGNFVQLAFWRDATGQYARLKSANGVVSSSTTTNSNNSQNFSGVAIQAGALAGFSGAAGVALPAGITNASRFRLYRGFGENLAISGRSAATVLDADYTRTVARGVFS